MATPSPGYLATIRGIDKFTEYSVYLFCLLNIPLIGANTYEVISRYGFGEPTEWALDTTTQSFGAMFMLGAAYALCKGAHVRTDMLWEKFSDRTKGKIDFYALILFFFPGMVLLFGSSWDDAWQAFTLGERGEQTAWRPMLWPLKSLVPLTAVLLMIQGTSEIMKSWFAMRTGRAFEHKAGGEI